MAGLEGFKFGEDQEPLVAELRSGFRHFGVNDAQFDAIVQRGVQALPPSLEKFDKEDVLTVSHVVLQTVGNAVCDVVRDPENRRMDHIGGVLGLSVALGHQILEAVGIDVEGGTDDVLFDAAVQGGPDADYVLPEEAVEPSTAGSTVDGEVLEVLRPESEFAGDVYE